MRCPTAKKTHLMNIAIRDELDSQVHIMITMIVMMIVVMMIKIMVMKMLMMIMTRFV